MSKDTKDAEAEKATRDPGRGRGNLERDILDVIVKVQAGEIAPPEGKNLTPHVVGKLIAEVDGIETAPSSGAISSCFDRWAELKFANINATPKFFKDFSAATKKAPSLVEALEAAKAKRREATKKAKAAAKAAEAEAAA